MKNKSFDGMRTIASALGLFLILFGVFLFGYCSYLVYQIFYNPEALQIWGYVASNIKTGDEAIHVSMVYPENTKSNYELDIKWSESVRLVVFSFVIVVLFLAVTSISSTFINVGSKLLKFGAFENNEKSS